MLQHLLYLISALWWDSLTYEEKNTLTLSAYRRYVICRNIDPLEHE